MIDMKKLIVLLAVAALTPMAHADVWTDLATYEYGAESKAPEALEALVKETPPTGYAKIEAKLVGIITSKTATEAGKSYACRMLQRVGAAKSVPALAALLNDKVLSHYARLALQRMESDPAALAAIRGALPGAPMCVQAGLIGSLGERGDTQSVGNISKLLTSDSPAVASSAMRALGKIGGAKALAALQNTNAPKTLASIRLEALVECAVAVGGADGCAALAKVYGDAGNDVDQRVAALTEMANCSPAKACPIAVGLIKGKPSKLRRGALRLVVMGKGSELTAGFVGALASLSPAGKAELLVLLGKRGDAAALPSVLANLKNDAAAVVKAAASAVGALGGPAEVPALLSVAAYDALASMGAEGVDAALIAGLSDPALRGAALTALARRGAGSAGPAAVSMASDPNADVRKAAWGAMAELAGEKQMAALVQIFADIKDGPELSIAQGAIRTICADAVDRDKCFGVIVDGTAGADAEVRLFVLDLGPVVGTGKALSIERAAIASGDVESKKRAVRALANWPNAAAAADLLTQAEQGATLVEKIVALRGCLIVSGRSGSDEQKVERLAAAAKLITRKEEKLLLVSQLKGRGHVSAMRLLKSYAAEGDVTKEAGNAMVDSARRIRGGDRMEDVKALLTWLAENAKDKDAAKRATDQLKGGRRR